MKKILLASIALCLAFTSNAQTVTQDFESGNRGQQGGLCWVFPGTSFKTGSNAINGSYGGRTGALSSTVNKMGVWSPWIDMATGNITFKHKLNGNFNGSSKKMEVIIQKYDDNSETTLYTFDYNSGNATTLHNASVAVNVSGVYRVKILFSGAGGSRRGLIDDISIPGTKVGDPSNSCNPVVQSADADNDGIDDDDDAYPNDEFRAANNYLVSSNYGTLMYEDLWPSRGDYDFNDLVVDYRINTITDADNEVVEMEMKIVARAVGASFQNAFAIELTDIAPNKILSVSGNKIPGTLFTTSSNGTESGQTHANIPIFDNIFNVLQYPGSGSGINTDPDAPKAAYDTIIVVVKFKDGVTVAPGGATSINDITFAKFNPYMIVNQVRGKEVHLIDKTPSDKADVSLFGTADDNSNVSANRYYKTANNLPWALAISESIPYAKEKADFSSAFTKFIEWAGSNGSLHSNWYMNNSGFRNINSLYNK